MSDLVKWELEKIQKSLNILQLTCDFPDLKWYTNEDWIGGAILCSSAANDRVDQTLFAYTTDAYIKNGALIVLPYLEVGGFKIFSNPTAFRIGQKNLLGRGDIPYTNWHLQMREFGLSTKIDELVEKYLCSHPPEDG